MVQEIRGSRCPDGARFAIVVSQFNRHVTSGLLRGARSVLADAGIRDEDVTIVHVPGAFEIPLTALRVAESGRYAAVLCLGCLIKGDTMHFEFIASATSSGIMDAATATGVPMAFGVLTTLSEEQALMRAADGPGNKGGEAARAALEMAALMPQIERGNERMRP